MKADDIHSQVRVAFVSDCGPENTVFSSQVINTVAAWRGFAPTDLLYRYQGDDASFDNAHGHRALPNLCRLLWSYEASRNHWRSILSSAQIVHCRGPLAFWMASHSCRQSDATLIADMRGLIVEELDFGVTTWRHWTAKPFRRREFRAIEEFAVRKADLMMCVSQPLSDYFASRYGRGADIVQPCTVLPEAFRFDSQTRRKVRNELGIGERDKVFIYSGGVARWQCLNLLGQFWRELRTRDPACVLLAITQEPAAFFASSGIEAAHNVRALSADHKEVPSYLFAADFGLLFRDDDVVNRVASPVKLSEYLATGLKVITNRQEYSRGSAEDVIDPASAVQGSLPVDDAVVRSLRSTCNIERLSNLAAVKRMLQAIEERSASSGVSTKEACPPLQVPVTELKG